MLNSGKIYSQKTAHTNTASPLQDDASRRISFYASSFQRFSFDSAGGSWRNWWRRSCSRWSGPAGGPGGGSPRVFEPKRKRCDIWSSDGNKMRRRKWELTMDALLRQVRKYIHKYCEKSLCWLTVYLIDEQRCHKFPWIEDIHNLADKLIIGCLGEVGFKADVRELWFRGDVNRPVSSLEREPVLITSLDNVSQRNSLKCVAYICFHSIHGVSTRVEHCGINHWTWNQVTNSTHLWRHQRQHSSRAGP